MIGHPPRSPLFPNTPLSRSEPPELSELTGLDEEQAEDVIAAAEEAAEGLEEEARLAKEQGVQVAPPPPAPAPPTPQERADRKSTRLNSSHLVISYAVFCLKN